MAYTKTPRESTYQTKYISLLHNFGRRDSSTAVTIRDTEMVNCYLELTKNSMTGEETYDVVKRDGLEQLGSITLGSAQVRGMYFWTDQNKLVVAVGNDLVIIQGTSVLATISNAFASASPTTPNPVGFTEFQYENNTVALVATDGARLGIISTANAWTASGDADLPPHIPAPVYLNGRIYIVRTSTADIYNSDLNNPLSWTPGNFITAEIDADNLVSLSRTANYLVAFGTKTIEFFYDAGIASGSPLQRNDIPVKFIGLLGGLVRNENDIYFIGQSQLGEPDVFQITGFDIRPLGTKNIRRYLNNFRLGLSDGLGYGNIISFQGHDFYCFTSQTTGPTLMMNLKTQLWSRVAYQATNNMQITFSAKAGRTSPLSCFVHIRNDNRILVFSSSATQDLGTNFTMSVVTEKQLFETKRQKFMSNFVVHSTQPTSDADLEVSWSDNDYQTFTTPRSLNLNQELPNIRQLGRFRERAFRTTFTAPHPLRIKGFEVEINMGQS